MAWSGNNLGRSNPSGRRNRRHSRQALIADINVTPLVDVMLVLLIIFMVTAPLLNSGVPIELPDSKANPLNQSQDQAIELTLDKEGQVFIDGEQVPALMLGTRFKQLATNSANKDGPLLYFKADKAVAYGQVMAIMGELNRAGLRKIALITSGQEEEATQSESGEASEPSESGEAGDLSQ